MKRLPTLILLLAILSGGILAGTAIVVQGAADHVTVTAETLSGTPSAAEGLELSLPVYCQSATLWDLTVPAARPEDTRTDFSFSPFGLRNADLTLFSFFNPYPMRRSISVEPDPLRIEIPTRAFSVPNVNSSYQWIEAVQMVADETPIGETHTRQLHLAEVYDSWPMEVYLDGNGIWFDPVGQSFEDYFSIPIPQDYIVTITITKNEQGQVTSVECDDGYPLDCTCNYIQLRDAILFTFTIQYHNYDANTHNLADGSAIPGGWGVYRLTTNEDKTEGKLETLFSLPQGSMVHRFWAKDDAIFLLTSEDQQLRLRQFSPDMELLDTIDLLPTEGTNSFYAMWEGDGYFVPIVKPEGPGEYRFAVVAQSGGDWEPDFSGSCALQQDAVQLFFNAERVLGVDYADGRLAICSTTSDAPIPSFWLAIYDQDGLAYLGRYTTSLSPIGLPPEQDSDLNYDLDFGELPFDDLSPSIRWQTAQPETPS